MFFLNHLQKGKCVLEVLFVAPEDDHDIEKNNYCLIDSDIPAETAEENLEIQEPESIDSDALSSITDTFPSNKFYPGIAKLCIDTSTNVHHSSSMFDSKSSSIDSSKKKETFIY